MMEIVSRYPWLKRWETLLFLIFIGVILLNSQLSEHFFGMGNIANIFILSIEKAMVVVIMAFVIINAEIDLSVASVMGFAACALAYSYEAGWPVAAGIILALLIGILCGSVNGLLIAYLELPSLVVTLAGLIAYRGAARILLEDRSVGSFPGWFTGMAQTDLIASFPLSVFIFAGLFLCGLFLLQYTIYGRYIYAIGNNREATIYAGLDVKRVKFVIFVASGFISALAGLFYAARLGNVRANAAFGFELDIITIVLLGGVSIFGGRGTMLGVGLSLLIVLNLRNGMSLVNINGHTQTSIVGALLILSVLIPNWAQTIQNWWIQRSMGDTTKAHIAKEVGNPDTKLETHQ